MRNISPLHILIATALAVTISVLPMGPIMMAIPWIIVVTFASKREAQRGRGAVTFSTYTLVTLSIVIAAILAPVKTTERVLERPLILPKTEMTIAEMDREANFETTEWLPRYIYVAKTPEMPTNTFSFGRPTSRFANLWIQSKLNRIFVTASCTAATDRRSYSAVTVASDCGCGDGATEQSVARRAADRAFPDVKAVNGSRRSRGF